MKEFNTFWDILDNFLNSFLYVIIGLSFPCILQMPKVLLLSVEALIKKNLGMEVCWDLYHAALSADAAKGDAILGTMITARKIKDSTKIAPHFADRLPILKASLPHSCMHTEG